LSKATLERSRVEVFADQHESGSWRVVAVLASVDRK